MGGGRGFVSVENIVDAFIRLTPNFSIFLPFGGIGEGKGTERNQKLPSLREERKALVDAQHSTLLLLSTCVHSLAALSSSLQLSHPTSETALLPQRTSPHLALLKLLHSRAASVPSFRSVLRSLTDTLAHTRDDREKHNNALHAVTTPTIAAMVVDAKPVEDDVNLAKQQLEHRQLVADVLFELSKPFVQRLQKAIEAFSSSNSLARNIDQAIKAYTSEKGFSLILTTINYTI